MNALLKTTAEPVTMTSLELVEFINNQRGDGEAELRHADFLEKVPKVLSGGERKFSSTYRDVQNKERPCYKFPKREACLMAMSYSYDLQAKVFDRMTALESSAAPALNLRDPRQLAAAALQLIEVNQELQATIDQQQTQISVMEPKVEDLNRISTADGALNLQGAAKALQLLKPNKFCDYLRQSGWIYKRAGGKHNLGYQDKVQAGYLTHKVTTVERSDGTEKIVEQVMVTPKGLTKLAEVVRQAGLH